MALKSVEKPEHRRNLSTDRAGNRAETIYSHFAFFPVGVKRAGEQEQVSFAGHPSAYAKATARRAGGWPAKESDIFWRLSQGSACGATLALGRNLVEVL